MIPAAKIRISEHKTKQKPKYLFLLVLSSDSNLSKGQSYE